MSLFLETVLDMSLFSFCVQIRYGRKANNYDLVITAARRYWNACLMLISEPLERQLLKEPLTAILECINATYKKDVKVVRLLINQ